MNRTLLMTLGLVVALGCGGKSRSAQQDGDADATDAQDTSGDVAGDAGDVPGDEEDAAGDATPDAPSDALPDGEDATDAASEPDASADPEEDGASDPPDDPATDTEADAGADPADDGATDAASDGTTDAPVDTSADAADAAADEPAGCVPPEVDCDGTCVDLASDHDHCGHCETACLFDEQCVSESCEVMSWSTVGRAVNMGLDPAVAHAIAGDGATPHVAMVLTDTWEGDVWVRRFEGLPTGWADVGPTLVPTTTDARPVVDIQFAGAVPYVVHHNGSLARVRTFDGSAWDEVGAPGFATMCMALDGLRFVLDGTEPHVTYMGAGGCGIGVGYFFHDATGWHHHPSTTGFPGTELVTMNGNGVSDIAYTDRAYVATGEFAAHRVKIWDGTGSAWVDHGGPLETNADTGWQEDRAMATDAAGNLYVAWSEQDGAGVGTIYVKAYTTDWTLLGAGPASAGGDATRPSIAIIDGLPWIAYQQSDGLTEMVVVRRYDGAAWERVGLPLNMSATQDGIWPDIAGIASIPYVAFREDDGTGLRVYVKTFP